MGYVLYNRLLDYLNSKKGVEMMNSKDQIKLHCVETCPVAFNISGFSDMGVTIR